MRPVLKNTLRWSCWALAGLVVAAVVYYALEISRARDHTRSAVRQVLDSPEMELTVSDLGPRRLQILLAVQDPAFFQHKGMDLSTPGAGLTTITQALVKILYFERFRPGLAKIKQTLIAVYALDPLVSKQDQLKLFINLIGLGQGTRGFAQAARHYYGKPLPELSEDQYISLVAMIMAPATFNLRQHPQRNAQRVARIKKLVAGQYQPKGLFDLSYGKLDQQTQQGLAPMSYFECYYRD